MEHRSNVGLNFEIIWFPYKIISFSFDKTFFSYISLFI